MKYYFKSLDDVLEDLKSNKNGLSQDEVLRRIEKYGYNKLDEGKKDSLLKKVLKQLSDPMLIVLVIAAGISLFVSLYAGESFTDTIIIFFVVALNTFLGVYQESKAEKAIEALNNMTKSKTNVIRDGRIAKIESEGLVVGDIVVLEAGDAVPADLRILESFDLKVEEAALTGESEPVLKTSDIIDCLKEDIGLSDRKNMLYMGSTVVYGRCKGIVVSTGMATEMGRIANYIEKAEKEETPLQKKLNGLSKVLSILVVTICLLMFVSKTVLVGNFSLENIIDTFMLAISLAVAAIPEGLASVVTIQLALGVTKMAKNNAIIRKLTAVETLGCTQIICSDKTGTLTQNKMTVKETYADDEKLLFTALSLCNNATLGNDDFIGDPTEVALLEYSKKFFKLSEINIEYKRVAELPFSSERKMMSTIHSVESKYIQFTKGAPDVILERCSKYYKDGKLYELNDDIKRSFLEQNKDMAGRALRVLGASCRIYTEKPNLDDYNILESNLVFLGQAGMIDPVKDEAIDAVENCKKAGIRPVMITGDHKDTAIAIAKQLGIISDDSEAITGDEIDKLSDKEFESQIKKFSVYARVQPEHKVRIVNTWKNLGKVVAMTGDGVNDAPSIKNADIGVGMGKGGTDVTNNVADMVLSDDDFSTIVKAVKEGRKIYSNIQKSIQFLISSNISEVLVIFVSTILGLTVFTPIQILWINLISDTFPALALGMEPEESDLMKNKPRGRNESLFSNGVSFDIAYQGFLIAIITMVSYFIGHFMESGKFEMVKSSDGATMAFVTLCLAEMFHVLNMRSKRNSIFKLKKNNWFLFGSVAISFILVILVVYIPYVSDAFELQHVNIMELLVAILLAMTVIPIVEIIKFFQRKK